MRAGIGCLLTRVQARSCSAHPGVRPQEGAKDRVQRERPARDVLMCGGVRDTSPEVTFNQQVATTLPDSQKQIPDKEWRFGCPQHSAVRNSRDTAWSSS